MVCSSSAAGRRWRNCCWRCAPVPVVYAEPAGAGQRRGGLIFRRGSRRSAGGGMTCRGLAQADMQTRMFVFELFEAVGGHEIEQAFELLNIHAGHRKAIGGGLLVLGFVCG